MKVLLINGSPNQSGCTYTALSEVSRALNACSIETEIFQLGTKPIQGCTACGRCATTKKCVFGDAATVLAEKMAACDGLIVGSPVYYASPNGALLSLLDRLFYSAPRTVFAHKPAAAIVSARRAGTTAALEPLTKYFSISQMPIVSSCYWPMIHGNTPEEARRDEEGLQIMRTLGQNMAYMLKALDCAKKNGITPPEGEKRTFTNFIR